MAMITIICPHCGFSRDVASDAVPVGTARVTCPQCRQVFTWAREAPELPGPDACARDGEMMRVSCPHCGFFKDMPRGSIPDGASVSCPRCRQKFQFAKESAGFGEAAPPPRPAWASTAGALPPTPRTLRFTFTGKASEYFGIWIVNTLLKMVTFGIYSAWAKVRKRRYFYGNTLLHDTPFDYLADPMALFKGWLIGAAAFIVYSVGTRYSPILASISGILFFIAMPWLVVRSRIFNARNSSHRNIRFNFRANYREAYEVFAGLYFLVPFTLGLLLPYVVYRQKKFLIEQSEYGNSSFAFDAKAKDFYLVFLKAVGGFAAIVGMGVLIAFLLSASFKGAISTLSIGKNDPATMRNAAAVLAFVPMLLFPVIYFIFGVYVQTALANLVWNGTRLAGNRFTSSLRTRDMTWLYFSNAAAIFVSLGLLIPWASIRLARYRFEHLTVVTSGDLESFVAAALAEVDAAGEEIGDIFGIDVAL